MSWIRRRPLTALAALALALRVACAVATEIKPIFPAYYYTDAVVIHGYALSALEDVRAGRPPAINGTLGERLQTSISLGFYRVLGPRPFVVKLFNAVMGALAVAAFAWAMTFAFPARAALGAGLAMAVWPSHVFYTSQNLKEAPVALMAFAALGAALAAGFNAKTSRARAASFALGAGLALLAAGFYRSYVLVCLGAAILAAVGLEAAHHPRTNSLLAAVAILAALAVHPSASRGLLASFHTRESSAAGQGRAQPRMIPVAYSADSLEVHRPTSPEGISRFRNSRQAADRLWAATKADREIGTQIYPGASFKTWLDVLFYLPKGAFTVLFMPLPGLYPMDGKIGRWAAAGENSALLLIALLAAAGFARGSKAPARIGLFAFFAMMTAGAALLEFDLGSAGRHKLLYLPMLFPFAAEEALRLFRGKEPV
ncbi:MAG: hypothetical protein HYX59_13160 [Elusimicrobia bacterium]|nr:hypothetical protein [Elusimicrobiota bacterium]